MSKRFALVGTILFTLALAGCGVGVEDVSGGIAQLPPCTEKDTPFEGVPIEDMSETYHAQVTTIINAHLEARGSLGQAPLQCTAGTYKELTPATTELSALAATLPEWTSRSEAVSEADLGAVLLEYLRVYECALNDRSEFLPNAVIEDEGEQSEDQWVIGSSQFLREGPKQEDLIAQELLTARKALDRTLSFLGGIDRLRPLDLELECLKRASLDLRNTLGLTAEAASCMPKIWDARSTLRDLPTP